MERQTGFYALLQFSAAPERLEFVNVGVVLVIPEIGHIGIRLAKGQKRVDRMFGPQPRGYLDSLKVGIEQRLYVEFRKEPSIEHLSSFGRLRANNIRLSRFQPVAISDAAVEIENIFDELVGDEPLSERNPRVSSKLRRKFAEANVLTYLDEQPAPVEMPEHGVTVSAPFGYRNGAYKLVAAMRVGSDSSEALREAGRRALEGQLLASYSSTDHRRRRLVVVGDFTRQSDAFYHTIDGIMRDHRVELYRLDHLDPLVDDIRSNHVAHHRT